MPRSDALTSPPAAGRPSDPRPQRRIALWAAGVAGLAVIALVAAATLPGSHSSGERTVLARRALAPRTSPANRLRDHSTKVFGSSISARAYGTRIADQEAGVDTSGQLSSDLSPLPAAAFRAPIAAYRRYAERWAVTLGGQVGRLTGELRAGDRAGAERAWETAFGDYLHLGAVYGLLPAALDDGLAEVAPSLGQRRFPGLHRIELGLWTGAAPRTLIGTSAAVSAAVVRLEAALPRVEITPLDYATRAHEILEDAQRDLMSGDDVPWSGAGVLGTAAGVAVTGKVVSTLVPLLSGRDNTLAQSQSWLARLQVALDSVRRRDHRRDRLRDGRWPALAQLTINQRERIDGALAGALGALEEIPGTLETARIPVIPQIPGPAR